MSGLGGKLDQLERMWHVQNIADLYGAWEFALVVVDEHGHGGEPAGQSCNHASHTLRGLASTAVAVAVDGALSAGLSTDELRDLLHSKVMSGVEVANAFELHALWQEQQQ